MLRFGSVKASLTERLCCSELWRAGALEVSARFNGLSVATPTKSAWSNDSGTSMIYTTGFSYQ